MDLTLFATQPVSLSRVKFWKVVVKCKIIMFFSKCSFLWLCTTYPISSIFSVLECIYKIHVFDDTLFLLAIVAMITDIFQFLYQFLLGKKNSFKLCSLSIQTILEKKWNQTDKVYWRKTVIKVYLVAHH